MNSPKKQSNKPIIIALLGVMVLALILAIVCVFFGNDGSNPGEYAAQSNANVIVLSLTLVFGFLALLLAVFFIFQSKLNKNRCPKCKMVNDYVILRQKELSHDTQMVTKKIQRKIKDTSGQVLKTTEEIGHVTVVKSVTHQQRKCKNCYHTWDVIIKKKIEY